MVLPLILQHLRFFGVYRRRLGICTCIRWAGVDALEGTATAHRPDLLRDLADEGAEGVLSPTSTPVLLLVRKHVAAAAEVSWAPLLNRFITESLVEVGASVVVVEPER